MVIIFLHEEGLVKMQYLQSTVKLRAVNCGMPVIIKLFQALKKLIYAYGKTDLSGSKKKIGNTHSSSPSPIQSTVLLSSNITSFMILFAENIMHVPIYIMYMLLLRSIHKGYHTQYKFFVLFKNVSWAEDRAQSTRYMFCM